jgi:hypothetical protein
MFAKGHEVIDRAIKKDDYRRGFCVEQVVGRGTVVLRWFKLLTLVWTVSLPAPPDTIVTFTPPS